jgi:dihydroflavonol-4-reductase
MAQRVLVTGANGFIASHTVQVLLARGFEVRGTVRDPNKAESCGFLRDLPGASERLELVAADLLVEGAFDRHAEGVDLVIHAASPYVIQVADPQADLVDPAVRGTLSLLRAAARSPRVKRVVVTSSTAAVTDEPEDRPMTEEDWNERSSLVRNPYYFSKAEAERAAWRFVKEEARSFELVVVNPCLVAGPSLSRAVNTTNQILVDLVNGVYPAIMDLSWALVDVRDVAEAHVRALVEPRASGRYLCAAETVPMEQLVARLRAGGVEASRLPRLRLTSGLGTALVRFAARFHSGVRHR